MKKSKIVSRLLTSPELVNVHEKCTSSLDEEASMKTMAAAEFKARCLRIIKQMNSDREPVTITNRGRPVALLSPMRPAGDDSPIGALRGSVLGFEDPFSPTAEPSDWSASE